MPPLRDPVLLAKILEALGEWNCDGYIQWKRRPAEWLRKNLPGYTQKANGRAMHDYALKGGKINQAKENYEGYRGSPTRSTTTSRFPSQASNSMWRRCLTIRRWDRP
jgi:hypothetical protein